MGADLNNIVKCQKLTDDHVQFLIYQILRGLKVSDPAAGVGMSPPVCHPQHLPLAPLAAGFVHKHQMVCVCSVLLICLLSPMQYIHSADIIHRVSW